MTASQSTPNPQPVGGNTPDKRERGLFGKYRVERVDGKGIDRCIVLELHDPNSWPALLQWAETVEADGYGQLAADVRRWVLTEQDIARVDAMIVGGDGVGMAHPGRVQMWDQEGTPPGETVWVSPVVHEAGGQS